jgi:MinD-like ATPase involved in chromosome partitioning or flagellar assembly
VTVLGAESGAGRTTVATNVAALLARDGRRVVLVDLDVAFAGATTVLAVPAGPGVVEHPAGFGVLCLATSGPVDASSLPTLLAGLAADDVVVDTPATFDDLVVAALRASALVLVVGTSDSAGLATVALTVETLDLLGSDPAGRRVVLNRAEPAGAALADAERRAGAPVAAVLPSAEDVVTTSTGPAGPSPLVVAQPGHPFSLAAARLVAAELAPRASRRWSR